MSKRVWNIVGRVVVWLLLVAFLVAAGILRHNNELARRVEKFEVVVADSTEQSLVSADELTLLINSEGVNPVGRNIDSMGLLAINNLAKAHPLVATARTYANYDNTVTLEVRQREPVVRFATNNGDHFLVTADLHILPIRNYVALDLPIVTGDIILPFPKGFEGNLHGWISANKKNNDKNYLFIDKLTNFVRYTEHAPWLKDKIVQIEVKQRGSGASQTAVVELIPREGNYVVALGPLTNINDKLDRWKKFVEAQVVELNNGVLLLEFDNQAVWRPLHQETKKKK